MSVVKFLKRNLNTKINGIQDPNLSWESKGLLAYLLSYSDEEFEANLEELVKTTKDNSSQLKQILEELIEYDYCQYFQLFKNEEYIESYFLISDTPIVYNLKTAQNIFSKIKNNDGLYKLKHCILKKESKDKNEKTSEKKEIKYDVQDLISKSEFLNYYSGIPKDLKKEIFDIVREIPLDILKKNKSKLSKMTIFEFQNHLIFLRKKYGA